MSNMCNFLVLVIIEQPRTSLTALFFDTCNLGHGNMASHRVMDQPNAVTEAWPLIGSWTTQCSDRGVREHVSGNTQQPRVVHITQ